MTDSASTEQELRELEDRIRALADVYRRAYDEIKAVKRQVEPQMDAAKEALVPLMERYREITGGNYADALGYVQVRAGQSKIKYDIAPILKRWQEDPITYHYVGGAVKLDAKALDKALKGGATWLEQYREETAGKPSLAIK
jgi:hypothetical protein